jgi:L-ascorbate peroxidase
MLRLAFSDVQTYDKTIYDWAIAGGSNGSIRFDYELNQKANTGLSKAIDILKPFKSKYPQVSWADLIQMAGALAVELTGGPTIDMRYGRIDVSHVEIVGSRRLSDRHSNVTRVSLSNRLKRYEADYGDKSPCPLPPYPNGALTAEVHLRNLFYRMGLTNRDIVAIMGAHTLGRAFHDRSGVCTHSSGEQGATVYTRQSSIAKPTGEGGVGMPGGCSWTKYWLTFDNSYYSRIDQLFQSSRSETNSPSTISRSDDEDLLWLPTDQALYDSPEFHLHFIRYARDQSKFFQDYAIAHKKMSELGAKFVPAEGIRLDDTL